MSERVASAAGEPTVPSAREEWRRYPVLPIAAAVGYATSVIHIYGLGPYITPISESFGWTRAQVTVGLTISTLIQAIFSVPIGLLVDRFGPRRFALVGILLTTGAFELLGTATGGALNWYMLWGMLAFATLPVQATIWTSAVATRFETSRGLAFAITLCGASVAVTVFPLLGTWLIGSYGWQRAVAIQGGIWTVIAFPIIFLFFRGAHDPRRNTPRAARSEFSGMSLGEGLRSTVYLRLLIASLLFTFTIIALVVHFVPILTDGGATPLAAAGIVSLVGIFSIAGRLATGLLLDRFSGGKGRRGRISVASDRLHLAVDGRRDVAGSSGSCGVRWPDARRRSRRHRLSDFAAFRAEELWRPLRRPAHRFVDRHRHGPARCGGGVRHLWQLCPFLWLTMAFMAASSAALLSLPRPAYLH